MSKGNNKQANNKQIVKLPPIQNPELKEAIASLKQGNSPENQTKLINAMKKAQLLGPCDFAMDLKPSADGKIHEARPNQIKFYLINTRDGKTFFPVFTDIDETKKIKIKKDGEPKYVVRKAADYDKFLQDPANKAMGIVINPGSDNIVFPKNLIGVLSGRIKGNAKPAAKTIPGGSPVNVIYSEPAVYPTRMVNAVHDHCMNVPSVSRVWIKQKTAAGQASFLLVVEIDQEDQAVLNGILEAAIPEAKDIPVEVIYYNEAVEKNIIKGAFALYDRELDL